MRMQRGFALLQVMLVFAILVIVAAKLQYDQRINIERTSQSLFLSQAQTYIDSAEGIAEVGLILDSQNTETDHLFELWNTTQYSFPLEEGGLIDIELNDLQGRFNLNWLSMGSPNRSSGLASFKRLLTLIDSDPDIADELYQWFDSDSGTDYFYADESPSYAPSFQAFADVSELLLLKSVDYAEFNKIKPYLSALPADSALNVNTAPLEMLQSVGSFIDEASASQAITDRAEDGFESTSEFLNLEVFQENEDAGIYIEALSVTSEWFELYTAVTLNNRVLSQRSVFYRDLSSATPVLRDRSTSEPNPMPGDPFKWFDEQELEAQP